MPGMFEASKAFTPHVGGGEPQAAAARGKYKSKGKPNSKRQLKFCSPRGKKGAVREPEAAGSAADFARRTAGGVPRGKPKKEGLGLMGMLCCWADAGVDSPQPLTPPTVLQSP